MSDQACAPHIDMERNSRSQPRDGSGNWRPAAAAGAEGAARDSPRPADDHHAGRDADVDLSAAGGGVSAVSADVVVGDTRRRLRRSASIRRSGGRFWTKQLQAGDAVLAERAARSRRSSRHAADDSATTRNRGVRQAAGQSRTDVAGPRHIGRRFARCELGAIRCGFVAAPGGWCIAASGSDDEQKGLQTPLTWELVYRAGSPTSEAALHFVESRLQASNESASDAAAEAIWNVAATCRRPTERHPISFAARRRFRWRRSFR